jgi:peptidoglycan/xylan/chitin deacetylase (PgdA/CDA1 family)
MSNSRSEDSMSGREGLPVLMCHDIIDQHAVTALSPAVFRSGLARLHAAGFRTVGLQDVADRLSAAAGARSLHAQTNGPRPFPENTFAITFDDGSQSIYTEGFPILQEYGFSATVFLTVGERPVTTTHSRLPAPPGRPMLSWGEIREMQRHGISFGAHTLTHPNLTRLPPARAEAEICTSQAIIADALGVAVTTFAYPFGYYDQHTREIASRHFACACSVRLGLVRAASDRYALERIDTYYLREERLFSLMLSPWFPWYIRARAIPRRIRAGLGWRMG